MFHSSAVRKEAHPDFIIYNCYNFVKTFFQLLFIFFFTLELRIPVC